jgi:hypothetical protein
MMRNRLILVMMVLILTGCAAPKASQPALPAVVDNAVSSGPTGLSRVDVSDGVMLVTPGQDSPVVLPFDGSSNPLELATATPIPTVDPASVVMPEGITLYPGATDIQLPTTEDVTGMGVEYIIFSTTDNADQVIQFYMENAAAAGWSIVSTGTEPDNMGIISQVWGKEATLLILQTWQPVDGVMRVQISWM